MQRYDNSLFLKQLFYCVLIISFILFIGWLMKDILLSYLMISTCSLVYTVIKVSTFNTINYTPKEKELFKELSKLKDKYG